MDDQVTDLNELIKRYKMEIDQLENKAEKMKAKINIAYQALQLLKDEGATTQNLFQPPSKIKPESLSDKYKDMNMTEAIMDVLKSQAGKYLSGAEIYNELMKCGFNSKSSNKKRDVYIRLNKLKKRPDKLDFMDNGKVNKYKYPTNSKSVEVAMK